MKTLIFFFSLICIGLSSPHRNLQFLRLLSPECNEHGYLYKSVCFCQSQWQGKKCELQRNDAIYDNSIDKCDDLIARLDYLINISPQKYDLDDDQFPRLTGNSIGQGDAAYGDKGSSWTKMHDVSKDFKIFNQFDTTDVKQGALGDCYLLAAFASLIGIRKGEVLRNAFITQKDNDKHVYVTRWLIDGKPRFVAVDDWVPGSDTSLSFAKPTEDNEFWPVILEKAWAKIYGTYMRTQGGWHTNVWRSLTQAPVFSAYHTSKNFNADTVFTFVRDLLDHEFAVGSATVGIPSTHEVGGHAYAILDAVILKLENGGTQNLFKMYNPWNSEVWAENPWGDESPKWTDFTKKQVNLVKNNDGIFYTSTQDYLSNFGMVNWAEIQKDYEITFQDIALNSDIDAKVDYTTKFTVKNNNNKNIYAFIDITDWRLEQGCGDPWSVLSLKVIDQNNKVYVLSSGDEAVIKIDNAPDGTYTILASAVKKKEYGRYFTLTVYAGINTVQFIDKENNDIKYKETKQCPNDCNGKGRCNLYQGICTCYFPNAGTSCNEKIVQKCPNDCSNNGKCDTLYGNCTCNSGFTGPDCQPCADTYANCDGYVNDGCCVPGNQYYSFTKDKCQKSCGEGGFKVGFESCYVDKKIPKPNLCDGKTCSGRGVCEQTTGKCNCNGGYQGNDCEKSIPKPPPVPVPTPDCKDNMEDCKPYIDANYCTQYPDNMKYYCSKSCKFC